MKSTSVEKRKNDRKRLIAVIASLCAVAFLITLGLVLSGCRKTTPPDDPQPTSGETSENGQNDPAADVVGTIASKRAKDPFYSPSSVSVTDSALYVSDATGFALYKMSPDGAVEKTVTFTGPVSRVKAEGGKVYALWGELDGSLSVFTEDLTLEKTVKVGHTPSDLYINGNTAYVANTFSGTVSVVDLGKGGVTGEIAVSREPYCMAAIGNDLYVGCRLQDGSAQEKILSSKVAKIDMSTGQLKKLIPLQNGAVNIRGIAATGDGKIVVTHTVARYTYPTTQLDRGWVNTNGFSLIDPATDKPTAYLLDEVESGAANPWGVASSADGKQLFFTIAGTSELITLDYEKLQTRMTRLAEGLIPAVSDPEKIIDHIEFLAGLKTRLQLPGEGVRAMTVQGNKIYVAEYFTGDIVVVEDGKTETVTASYPLGKQPEQTPERLGESVWFSAKYTYQKWESCSSCHPYARPDGLNWDEEGDGIGTPKNTKSMIFSHRTPPVLTTGCVDTAEDNVMGTFREAFRSTLDEEVIYAVDSFLRAQLPLESPHLNEDGSFTASAQKGKELFEQLGCTSCHPAPLYTDLQFHKSPYLGSDGTWEDRAFITPTLVEIWRSAPYTYSGCETDIKNVIKKFTKTTLTDEQLADLAKFVLSIGTVGEDYGVEQVFLTTANGETALCRLEKGAKLTEFTLRRQQAGKTAPPVVTAKLVSAAGETLAEQTFEPGEIAYNTAVKIAWGAEIPDDLQKGVYLEITVKDASGNALASPYKLVYSV